uniref:Roadblock/LAMTOR2 domain-containing protein n=1 Tax=Geoglobus ahangari TaxID=113653 RepID=A0A7C4WEK7_9EURY
MIWRLKEVLRTISEDPSIEGVIIYRVDGVPIASNLKENRKILEHLYVLENQIKTLLSYIFNQNLDDTSIKIKELKVKLYPITKTLVLVALSNPSADFRVELEIKRIINELREILLNEF